MAMQCDTMMEKVQWVAESDSVGKELESSEKRSELVQYWKLIHC